jgi:hypothetical protein
MMGNGDTTPEINGQVREGVRPAQVVPAKRPENVEKAMKEAAEAARTSGSKGNGDAAAKSTPPPDIAPPIVEGPKQPVPQATVKAARPTLKNKSESEAQEGLVEVGLSLHCQPKQQVGKSFIVVVSLDSNAPMTGANIALKYDPALLQLKAVRDGGLLGSHPDITHQVAGGNLLISIRQTQEKAQPVKATGKLVVVEFTALGAGQTSIDINGSETQFKLAGDLGAQINAMPVKLQISREAVSSLEK